MKSLVLLGVLSTVLAIENKTVRNGKPTSSKGGPKRLRRNQETTPLSDAKFGRANLIAKWVKEAKEAACDLLNYPQYRFLLDDSKNILQITYNK